MSMPQVYLFETRDHDDGVPVEIFSSKEKAKSQCNRNFDKPNFSQNALGVITVSVSGPVVGWITKKIVQ